MNAHATTENARTLAQLLGISEEEATERLSISIAVTASPGDANGWLLAAHAAKMMSRTVRSVVSPDCEITGNTEVELIVGNVEPRSKAACVFVAIDNYRIVIARHQMVSAADVGAVHPIVLLMGACYSCAALMKAAIGDGLPYSFPDIFELRSAELFGNDLPPSDLVVDIGETYLAGAGAIGNGFVWGLSQFTPNGLLHVCDDDAASAGNLQRCVYFEEHDEGRAKASLLCAAIGREMPGLSTTPFKGRLQSHPKRRGGAWLSRLVVGVDASPSPPLTPPAPNPAPAPA